MSYVIADGAMAPDGIMVLESRHLLDNWVFLGPASDGKFTEVEVHFRPSGGYVFGRVGGERPVAGFMHRSPTESDPDGALGAFSEAIGVLRTGRFLPNAGQAFELAVHPYWDTSQGGSAPVILVDASNRQKARMRRAGYQFEQPVSSLRADLENVLGAMMGRFLAVRFRSSRA